MAQRPESADAENMRLRIGSSLVLVPASLGFIVIGDAFFFALLLVGALIGIREWLAIIVTTPPRCLVIAGWLTIAAVFLVQAWLGGYWAMAVALVGGAFLGAMARGCNGLDRLWVGSGIPYLAAAALALLWLRALEGLGMALVLFLMVTVWATDVAAFLVGRELGGPRLWRDVSPSKTWAGLAGGMLAAGGAGGMVAVGFGASSPWLAALMGVAIAVAGQAGDLFESGLKRRYKVKDSGTLIPGHGGLLDRVDGLLMAAPMLAVFHAMLGASIGWW